jgi:hypothetical protein
LKLIVNAQRLLKPSAGVNPFAEKLNFPDGLTRTRRDHIKFLKFLTPIRGVTLLHQYQRPVLTVPNEGSGARGGGWRCRRGIDHWSLISLQRRW